MSNAIASVAHRMMRGLGLPNMRRARPRPAGHFVDAAWMKRVAAADAPNPEPQPAPYAVGPHRLERVLRAARVETAARTEQRAQQPLVRPDQELDCLCAHASLIWFHKRSKAARNSGAGAFRAAGRALRTMSTGGSASRCNRNCSRACR